MTLDEIESAKRLYERAGPGFVSVPTGFAITLCDLALRGLEAQNAEPPADMVLLPREPTQEMLKAIVIAYDSERDEHNEEALADARIIYKAMLAESSGRRSK